MDSKPTPITQTLQQRLALAHYSQVAADAEAYRRELDRAQRIVAEHETEQLLKRVRHSGTGECHATAEDAPDHLPTWRDAAGLYATDIAIGLLFVIVWGGVMVATWMHGPELADYVGGVLRFFGGAK